MFNLYFVFEALLTRPPEQCCCSLSLYPLRLIQALFSFGTLSLSLFIPFSGSRGKISNLSPNPFSHVCLVYCKRGVVNVKAREIFSVCGLYLLSQQFAELLPSLPDLWGWVQTALDAQTGVCVRGSSMPWAKSVNNKELLHFSETLLHASLGHMYLWTLYLHILKF